MSFTEDTASRWDAVSILPPYTPDRNSRAHRRSRALAFAFVIVFCLFYGSAFALLMPFLVLPLMVPIALLALIAVWALPDVRRPPTQTLAVLTFAFVVCLVMWPSYIALALPGLPWITMVRITGIPLTLMLMVCVSTSAYFRTEVAKALKSTPILWKVLLAFVFIQLVSIGLSHSVFDSVDKFLIAQTSWTAIYFVSAFIFLRPGRMEKMAALMWAMAIVVGLIGIAEWRVQHVLWAGHIPSFLQINDKTVARALAGSDRAGTYRAKSTFENALGFGEYMALTMPFVLRFAIGPYSRLIRFGAMGSMVLIMFATWTSHSRCGTIGVPLSVLLYAAGWAVLKWRRDRSGLLGPAITLGFPAISAVVLGLVIFVGRIRAVFVGNGSENSSTADRYAQIELGIPKILSHPWGYGIGQGANTLGFAPYGTLTIDNYYLDVTLEYGVLGFIVYFGMLLVAIFYCAKALFDIKYPSREGQFLLPIAVSLTVFFLIKSSFSEQNNHPLVFMMMGMVSALVYRAFADQRSAREQQSVALAPSAVPPPRRGPGQLRPA